MNLVFSRYWRISIVVFITLLIVFEMFAYAALTPRASDSYFQFYVLGSDHLASNYFPGNDSVLVAGEQVRWYVDIVNNMGDVELASIVVKIGNSTTQTPTMQNVTGTNTPILTNFEKFMQDNETWEIPLVWDVSNVTASQASVRITSIQINNATLDPSNWTATNGNNFQLIFELWTWQTETNSFQFGWGSGTSFRIAWLRILFSVSTGTH